MIITKTISDKALMLRAIVFISLFCSLSPFSSCRAREIVAVGTHFSRVFELDESGQHVGLGVDILTRLARRNGDTIRFELYPWTRAQLMVEQGRADILIGPYKNVARAAKMNFFNQAFYLDDMVFYRLIGSKQGWNGEYASLMGKRIAKVKNWAYGPMFMSQSVKLQVQDFTTLRGAVIRLGRGDLDLVASNVRNTEAFLQLMEQRAPIEAVSPIITLQRGYFAFSKTSTNKITQTEYEKRFDEMITAGELATLGIINGVRTP